MAVQITPVGVSCNLSCTYCYQNTLRDAGNFGGGKLNWDKLKNILDEQEDEVSLFGGEVLLTPKKDLEKLLSYSYERFGSSSIQTNGTLIDDEHIDMFHKYNTSLGFSFDGWGKLNDLRWAGTLEETRKNTEKTLSNLEKLIHENISVSVILTLHNINVGTEERYESFKNMLVWLDNLGVDSIRLHDLEVDNDLTARKHVLPIEKQKDIFLDLAEFSKEISSLQVDIFDDIRNLLLGTDQNVTCVWGACDPYVTEAVTAIGPEGSKKSCEMANKEGVGWEKSDETGFERYVALYQTPQEYGGCKGCPFFSMCKGQCPGRGIDGDWRNKSDSCELWKSLFNHFEEVLVNEEKIIPLSLNPARATIEKNMVEAWKKGYNIHINEILNYIK